MSQRAKQVQESFDQQIAELQTLVSTLDETRARIACPGRRKLGDGTVAALAMHTAENYQRIAAFMTNNDDLTGERRQSPVSRGSRVPRILRALGHRPPTHAHGDDYSADALDAPALMSALSESRTELARIGELTDEQLDTIPPPDSFRFCDGDRNLEQVTTALLKHQQHQLQTIADCLS